MKNKLEMRKKGVFKKVIYLGVESNQFICSAKESLVDLLGSAKEKGVLENE